LESWLAGTGEHFSGRANIPRERHVAGEPIIYGSAGASPSQEVATYKPLLNVMSDLYSPTSRTSAHLRED
jgi:hypothetical protein